MRKYRSLSLLETTLSLVLLLVVLGAVFTSVNVASRSERNGRERQAAKAAANAALQELRVLPFEETPRGVNLESHAFAVSANSGAGPFALPPASAAFEPLNTAAEDRAGHVSVLEDPEGDGTAELLELRVVVAWRSTGGADERLELVTRRVK